MYAQLTMVARLANN